jgi:hypothetical protein
MNKTKKIYTVFLSTIDPVGFDAYRNYHHNIKVMENRDILEKIKNESKDVEFVGGTGYTKVKFIVKDVHLSKKAEITGDIVSDIKKQKEDLDGLLIFAESYTDMASDELISIGLPTIVVKRPLKACSTLPFHPYDNSRVLTSHLPFYCDKDPEIYSRRIKDIAKKVRLICAISKMRDLRMLVVTDMPPLGYFEPIPIQIDTTREEYDKAYMDNLRETFGTELIAVPQKELFEKIKKADEVKSKEIADKWIYGAVTLRGTTESEVLKSAKLYLAMKELMEQYDCQAITTEGFGWPPLGFKKATEQGIPSQGLPTTQFCTDGTAAASETLTDCLITQQLGLYITGSTGLLGDYSIDPMINTAIVAHCEGTLRPYGDERITPYIIRNLPFVEENTGGACAQAIYPINENVTVVRIGMYAKKLAVFTGRTISGEELFPYWDDILGRNKVAIRTNAKALFENVDWKSLAHHRVVLFGNYRQEFKDLAKLIGYEVVEEDKLKYT